MSGNEKSPGAATPGDHVYTPQQIEELLDSIRKGNVDTSAKRLDPGKRLRHVDKRLNDLPIEVHLTRSVRGRERRKSLRDSIHHLRGERSILSKIIRLLTKK